MTIKLFIALKFFGFLVGLTMYNFLYENYINTIILNSISGIKYHFTNSTLELPDAN